MKVRAAIALEVNKPLEIVQVELGAPQQGEVLVQMKASGICHSDLHVLEGHLPRKFPIIMGHEGAGIVVECGPGVTMVKPGDHVIPCVIAHCGECDYCQSGRTHLCRKFMTARARPFSRFTYKGAPVTALSNLGTFAEYAVLPEIYVAKIRNDAPLDTVCYVGCGVVTGVGAVINTAKVQPGASVAVFGTGGIGLNAIQGAKMAGAAQIIAVDTNAAKEAPAREFGATHFVNPANSNSGVVDRIRELSGGGVDFSFECVGIPALMRQALECTEPAWGVCTLVGIAEQGKEISVPPGYFIFGRTLRGCLMGGARGRIDLPKMVDWYMKGMIKVDELITHRMPLEEINHGFDLMRQGKSIRSVVIY